MPQRITWTERLQMIADRIRVPDLFTGVPSDAETGSAYHNKDVVEGWTREAVIDMLLGLSQDQFERVGSPALLSITAFISGSTEVPINALRVIGVAIQQDVSGPFVPATYADPVTYHQLLTAPMEDILMYTLYGGKLYFKGFALKILFLVEPTLASLQSDDTIVPPGFDEDIIDWVHKLMLGEDFLPLNRL